MNKKGLGRGLEHLFEQADSINSDNNQVMELLIDEIKPNPYQPRKTFDEKALNELAMSIKENGVFQPILVRSNIIGYEIISGERRYRASQIAGLKNIPAIIYNYDDKQMMEVALIENIQRENLNPIEEAMSYKKLLENLDYTQEGLAERIGKSRSHISNLVRLLALDDTIKIAIQENQISMGHAKIIAGIKDSLKQKEIFQKIIENKLSVRETENLLKMQEEKENKKESKKMKNNITNYERLENILKDKLATKVQISGKDKGQIKINYLSEDDLERILEILNLI